MTCRFSKRASSAAVLLVVLAIANSGSDAFVPVHRHPDRHPSTTGAPLERSIYKGLELRRPARGSTSRLYYIHRKKARSGPDYYAILEISKTANRKEIKDAYRRLAKLYHPDANPGKQTSEQFQTISRAYEILKDPALKKKYDLEVGNYQAAAAQATATATDTPTGSTVWPGAGVGARTAAGARGRTWPEGGSSAGWTSTSSTGTGSAGWTSSTGANSKSNYAAGGFYSPRDHFYTSGVDGFQSPFSAGGSTTKNNGKSSDYYKKQRSWGGPVPGDDLRFDLEIDLKTAMFGGDQEIRIRHMETCRPCNGKGVNEEANPKSWRSCTTCGGTGSTPETTQTPLGTFHTQQVCRVCHGTGRERIGGGEKAEDYCGMCDAQGITSRTKRIKVTIPPNVKEGNKLLIRGEGDAGFNGGPTGDLYIYISVRQQATYTAPPNNNYYGTSGSSASPSSSSSSSSSWSQYSSGPSKTASNGANFDNYYSPNWNDEFFSVTNEGPSSGFTNDAASQTDTGGSATKNGASYSTSAGTPTEKNPNTVTDTSGTSYAKNFNIYGPDDIGDSGAKKDGQDNPVSFGSRYGRDATWSSGASTSNANGAKVNGAHVGSNNYGASSNVGASASSSTNSGASQSGADYNRAYFSVDEGVNVAGDKSGGSSSSSYSTPGGAQKVNFNNGSYSSSSTNNNKGASSSSAFNGAQSPNPFNNRANFGFTNGASDKNTNSAKYSPNNGFNSNTANSGYGYSSGVGNSGSTKYTPKNGYSSATSSGYSSGGSVGSNNNGAKYSPSNGYSNGATVGNTNTGAKYSPPTSGYSNGATVGNSYGAKYSPTSGYSNGAASTGGYSNGATVGSNNGAKYSSSNAYSTGANKAPPTDFFANGVSDSMKAASAPGRAWTRGPVVGSDLIVSVEVDMKKAIMGGEELITFGHLVTCDACFGSGAKRGTKIYMCSACGGSGVSMQSLGGSIPSPQQQPCGHCRGTGHRFQEGCDVCSGRGSKPVTRELKVLIPPGAEEGNQLYVQGEGDAGPNGGPPGDLYINLKVRY